MTTRTSAPLEMRCIVQRRASRWLVAGALFFSAAAHALPLFESGLRVESKLQVGDWSGGDTPGIVELDASGAQAMAGTALHQAYTYASKGGSGSGQSAGDARAQVLPGMIRLQAAAAGSAGGTGQGASLMFTDANARLEGDIIFAGPSDHVSGSFTLLVDGLVDWDAVNTGIGRAGAGLTLATVDMQLISGFPGPGNVGVGHLRASKQVTSAGVVTESFIADGLLTGYSGGSAVLTVPFTNLLVGVPLRWSLDLGFTSHSTVTYVATHEGENFDGLADADLNFYDTISFVRGVPTFQLPDGFVANSEDLNVVDSIWMGVPVPEPGRAALVGLGLGLMGLLRSRRQWLSRDA